MYKINKIEKIQDVVILDTMPEKGEVFNFIPGQFIMLTLYNTDGEISQQRPFSICSSPLNKNRLQLAIKIHGEFTQKVATLKNGDYVGISKPTGFFTFNEKRMENSVFIAGGIGITPFMSAVRYISEKGLSNKITLLYSNKTKKNIIFLKELESLSKEHKNIEVIFTLTDKIPDRWKYEQGRIDITMIKKYCLSFDEKYFSVCGPSGFIESIITQLEKSGVTKDYIDMERF